MKEFKKVTKLTPFSLTVLIFWLGGWALVAYTVYRVLFPSPAGIKVPPASVKDQLQVNIGESIIDFGYELKEI